MLWKTRFLYGVVKKSWNLMWRLYSNVNVLKATELYTFKWLILWYVLQHSFSKSVS